MRRNSLANMRGVLISAYVVILVVLESIGPAYGQDDRFNDHPHGDLHEMTPYFYDHTNATNVTAQLGSTAFLNCRVNRLRDKMVSWVLREDAEIKLLTWGLHTYSNDARYSLNFEHPNNWKLQVKYTQRRDEGLYECQVSTDPPKVLLVRLNIVAPVVEIIDERGAIVHEKFYKTGSTIELKCTISQMPQAQTFIRWRHGDQMLNYDTSRGGISVKTDMSSSVIVSTLFIANATPKDSGNYTCSLGVVATRSVHAHILNDPKLQPPCNVTVKDNEDGTVLISWLPSENSIVSDAYYDIEYKNEERWTFKKLNRKQIVDKTNFTAKNLNPGIKYTIRVFSKTLTSFEASAEVEFIAPMQNKDKMPRVVHISTGEELLEAMESVAPQEGITINITGPVQVIVGSHVSAAEQCTGGDGFCVETGDSCNGTIKMLHNFCNDHCTCCVPDKQGCPEGFFMSDGSTQCFKIFMDVQRTWYEAKEKCEAEGLQIAQPSDAVAVALRKDLLDSYGDGGVWLDGRGDGSKFVWEHNMTELRNDSLLWLPGQPAHWVATHNCLGLHVYYNWWSMHPEQPYSSYVCSWSYHTLCEDIRE